MMTAAQGQALVALLGTLRKDWGLAGITAALKKASPLGSAAEVAVAACRVAANGAIRTPALIADPGPHWQGLAAGSRLAPLMCTDHPEQKAGSCAECFKAAVPRADLCPVPKRDKHVRPFVPNAYGSQERCHAAKDGERNKPERCPQIRDDEPLATGRHCPLDTWEDDE